MNPFPLLVSTVALALAVSAGAEVRVPAFTAYAQPNGNGIQISEKTGIAGWKDAGTKVIWGGRLETAGDLKCSVAVRLGAGATSRLKLTVQGVSREAVAKGAEGQPAATADFGTFPVKAGWVQIVLESLNGSKPAGEIDALVLDGPAAANAQFNLLPRRNAASVHLNCTLPKGSEIDAFYAEGTAVEDPTQTFYMVCGFQRGYFGMQVNGPNERRIIFSVWDSGAGKSAMKRDGVDAADQVALLGKGEGVTASAFGGEGTGGHSHLVYPWKTGEKQRFLLTAKPAEKESAIYSGYWYHPEKKEWMLIASFRAPKASAALGHFHSFSENFGGANGQLRRKALYSNQWVHLRDGKWSEVTEASFSHDATGKTARLDREMGEEKGQFFLAHGGFTGGSTPFGQKFSRKPTGVPPEVDLQKLPSGNAP